MGLLVASRQLEAELGPHGIEMWRATDPAIAGKVRTELVVDYVARDLELTQKQYAQDFDHQEQAGWRFVATVDDD